MIVQKEFINKLKDFGLNSYESKLWIALLSRGVSTAGELSDISNVPRSRAYDVLESLEKKGFIIVKVGKPIKYLAVPPAEVIERVKKKVQQEAEERHTMLSQLKDSEVLGELNVLHTEGIKLVDPTDKSGAFRGREKVHEHLLTMVKNAKKSITILTSKDGLDRKYELLANPLKKAVKAGIDVRIVAPLSASKETIENFSKIAKIKQLKTNSNARFCMVDEVEMLMFLTDDEKVHKSYDCAVWVEAPFFVQYFNSLFENEWKGAK
ncbi:TrmB family transcriptional regulator [Candidatus Woesearchaeota archaeon]|nr:TrmB family transcriptional regulator [Candidatus Woesearchaeota archaeon]